MTRRRPTEELQGYQRKYLRGLAHGLKAVVLVGQGGISAGVVEATKQALLDHELVKVHMREPEDKKAMSADLARRCGAHLCGVIGHNAILYRQHPEEPTIELPRR